MLLGTWWENTKNPRFQHCSQCFLVWKTAYSFIYLRRKYDKQFKITVCCVVFFLCWSKNGHIFRTHTHVHIYWRQNNNIRQRPKNEKILSGYTRSRNLFYDSYKSVVKLCFIYVSIGLICFNIFAHFFDNSYSASSARVNRLNERGALIFVLTLLFVKMHTCIQLRPTLVVFIDSIILTLLI